MAKLIILKLTPIQAKILWNTVDGAADAGACKDGNTNQEAKALEQISTKLMNVREQWKHVKLTPG